PRPVQRPRPPIVVGAVSVGTAGLVARRADGVMPVFTRPDSRPDDYAELQEAIRRECLAIGRPTSEIAQVAFASFRLSGPDDAEARRRPRSNLGGTPEQVLEDLERYAEAGYSIVNLAVVAPSATHAETAEQTEWL